MPNFNVIGIPMYEDNLAYYIHMADDIQKGWFVDTAEIDKVTKFRNDFGITSEVTHILTTHKHYDHAGANKEIKTYFKGVNIVGGKDDNVPGCTVPVKHGDTFDMFDGQVKLICYHTPCHTRGSICYYLEASGCVDGEQHQTQMKGGYPIITNLNRCVFTGDTVFTGGCGYFMEGNAAQMLKAMDIVSALPDDTKVFVGHEYTQNNFIFLNKAEGKTNGKIAEFWAKYKAILQSGGYIAPSMLGDEKQYNSFMRCRTQALQ